MATVEFHFCVREGGQKDGAIAFEKISVDIDCDAEVTPCGEEVDVTISAITLGDVDLLATEDPWLRFLGAKINKAALADEDWLELVEQVHGIFWKPTPDLYSPHEGHYEVAA